MWAWLRSNWLVIFPIPIIIWAMLIFVVVPEIPEDPRDPQSAEVAKKIEMEVSLRLHQIAQALAQAKAEDLVGKALDDAVEQLVKEEMSLSDENAVESAVSQAVNAAVSEDGQLKNASVGSIETIVTAKLSEGLVNLPMMIVRQLDTSLSLTVEEELVDDTLADILPSVVEQDVSLNRISQPEVEGIVSEAAVTNISELDVPPLEEEALTVNLTDVVTEEISRLEGKVIRGIDGSEIKDSDADEIADAVAGDIIKEIDDIVEVVVKSEADPKDTEVVKAIAETLASKAIQGQASSETVAAVLANEIEDNAASIRAAQVRGAGSLGWLRELFGEWVWRLAIASAVPWLVFVFLVDLTWRARQT